jgi:hypothetical protein
MNYVPRLGEQVCHEPPGKTAALLLPPPGPANVQGVLGVRPPNPTDSEARGAGLLLDTAPQPLHLVSASALEKGALPCLINIQWSLC